MDVKKHKSAAGQLEFALTQPQRLGWIDSLDPADYEITPRAWRTLRELLRQIEFTSSGDESFARVEVLAARMGVTDRTIQRAREILEAKGLITVKQRKGHNGQMSNLYRITYPGVAPEERPEKMSPPGDEMSPTPDRASPTPDGMSPIGDGMSPPLRNTDRYSALEINKGSTSFPPLASASTDDQKKKWAKIESRAAYIAVRLGKSDDLRDRDFVLKVATLVERGILSEHEVASAANGAFLKGANRFAYFTTCLKESLEKRGLQLRQQLVKIEIPPEVLARPAPMSIQESYANL